MSNITCNRANTVVPWNTCSKICLRVYCEIVRNPSVCGWAQTARFAARAVESISRMTRANTWPFPYINSSGTAVVSVYNAFILVPLPSSFPVTGSQTYRFKKPEEPLVNLCASPRRSDSNVLADRHKVIARHFCKRVVNFSYTAASTFWGIPKFSPPFTPRYEKFNARSFSRILVECNPRYFS